jgi:hypothetical protein
MKEYRAPQAAAKGWTRPILRLELLPLALLGSPNAAHGAYPGDRWTCAGRSANLSTPPSQSRLTSEVGEIPRYAFLALIAPADGLDIKRHGCGQVDADETAFTLNRHSDFDVLPVVAGGQFKG